MKIIILGSGTCVPSLERSSCSVLVKFKACRLLFDTGAGTMRRLLEANTKITDITHIFYSHIHPDHVAEFVTFLFSTKHPELYVKRTPFSIIAARGFFQFYKKLQGAFNEWIVLKPGLMNIIEMENSGPDQRDFGKFILDTRPMAHTDQSIGFRVTANGKSVVYSGDTDVCDDLVKLSKGADVLICESALPDELKTAGHLTPSEAGKIAQQAKVKHLVLTHFYPECEDVDIAAQCRKAWSGKLTLAKDLMEIEV